MDPTNEYSSDLYKAGDRLLVGVLTACLLLSFALAPWYHTWPEALAIGVPSWGVCVGLMYWHGGKTVTRCAIAAALMVFATLEIHQAHGMIESHFTIFVLLAFLLYYRHWLPLVVGAGVIAVLHLVVDVLQSAGNPVWVFASGGGLGIVLLHAAFVIFETALLVWMAVKLRGEIEALGGDPKTLSQAAQALASGDLAVEIGTRGAGAASLACAMETMRAELQARTEQDRAASRENARIRVALDCIGAGAMLVDLNGVIVYVNDFAAALFRRQAAEICKRLPQFDPERVAGENVGVFCDIPLLETRRLAELSASGTEDVVLGDARLRIVANPVADQSGNRLGTVVQWQDRTQEVITQEEIQNVVTRANEGDLTARLAEAGKEGFFIALAVGMNSLIANLASVIAQVKSAADVVHRGVAELSQGNLDLSQRTEQQASSLEQTASAMEEMTSSVQRNAENVVQANQLAAAAHEQAAKGGAVVSQAVRAMTEIHDSSKMIADIISVIDEIAFQTNLLALNAAVEAAHAGEQGRGFAVVASEVRTLAGRSAEAAKQIKALISDSVRKVAHGSVLVTQSGVTLEQIVVAVGRVSHIVSEVASATHEQSAGIEEVNKAVMQLDMLTQQNSALVEEASAASQSMAEQARALNDQVARYQLGDSAGIHDDGQSRGFNAERSGPRTSAARSAASLLEGPVDLPEHDYQAAG